MRHFAFDANMLAIDIVESQVADSPVIGHRTPLERAISHPIAPTIPLSNVNRLDNHYSVSTDTFVIPGVVPV